MKKGFKKETNKTIGKGYLGDAPMEMKTTVSFSDKELPEIKKWEVGSTYKLVMEVKQKSLSQDEYGEGDEKHRASFEVLSVKPQGD